MLRSSVALVLLASFATSVSAQEVAYRPKPGSSLTRTQTVEVKLAFDRIQSTINGMQAEAEDLKVEMQETKTLEVFEAVSKWDPKGERIFEREYLQTVRNLTAPIAYTVGDEVVKATVQTEGHAALQGERLYFHSPAPNSPWVRRFAEDVMLDEQEPREVPAVAVDLDMSCLLPPPGTKVGATWKADPHAFLGAVMADHGMDTHFSDAGDSDLPLWIGSLSQQPEIQDLWDEFDIASVTCKLLPRRKAGRLNLHPIQVTVNISGSCDLEDWAMDTIGHTGEEGIELMVEHAFQSSYLTGAGMYLWDIDHRTMHSFVFQGDSKFSRSQSLIMQKGDETTTIDMECDGSFQVQVQSSVQR